MRGWGWVPSMGWAGGRGGSEDCPAHAQILQQCASSQVGGRSLGPGCVLGRLRDPGPVWAAGCCGPSAQHMCTATHRPFEGHPAIDAGGHTQAVGMRVQQDHAGSAWSPRPGPGCRPGPGLLPPRLQQTCGGPAEGLGSQCWLQLGHLLGGHSVLCAAHPPALQPQPVWPGVLHASTHPLPTAARLPSICFLQHGEPLPLERTWSQGGGWERQMAGHSYKRRVREFPITRPHSSQQTGPVPVPTLIGQRLLEGSLPRTGGRPGLGPPASWREDTGSRSTPH